MKLDLPVADVQLLVRTLEQIQCPSVQAWATCQQAVELLKAIREQAKAQGQ